MRDANTTPDERWFSAVCMCVLAPMQCRGRRGGPVSIQQVVHGVRGDDMVKKKLVFPQVVGKGREPEKRAAAYGFPCNLGYEIEHWWNGDSNFPLYM